MSCGNFVLKQMKQMRLTVWYFLNHCSRKQIIIMKCKAFIRWCDQVGPCVDMWVYVMRNFTMCADSELGAYCISTVMETDSDVLGRECLPYLPLLNVVFDRKLFNFTWNSPRTTATPNRAVFPLPDEFNPYEYAQMFRRVLGFQAGFNFLRYELREIPNHIDVALYFIGISERIV